MDGRASSGLETAALVKWTTGAPGTPPRLRSRQCRRPRPIDSTRRRRPQPRPARSSIERCDYICCVYLGQSSIHFAESCHCYPRSRARGSAAFGATSPLPRSCLQTYGLATCVKESPLDEKGPRAPDCKESQPPVTIGPLPRLARLASSSRIHRIPALHKEATITSCRGTVRQHSQIAGAR